MLIRHWIPVALAAVTVPLGVLGPVSAATFTVSPGSSISTALGAAASGDSVLVEEGTYHETVTLVSGVALLGGYDATFSEAARSPILHPTILHGDYVAPVVISGPSVSSSTIVDGFVITGGSGDGGAGIIVNGGAPVFSNNDIRENRDGVAGAAHVFGGSTATFRDNRIAGNQSAGSGGGIRVEQSDATLVGNSFFSNIAPNSGGALYIFESDVMCSSNTFGGCRAGEGGGGIYLQRVGTGARFVDNAFYSCEAQVGGAIQAKNESFPTFERQYISGCRAVNGGGIAATSDSDITLVDCALENCTADVEGGGLWCLSSNITYLGSAVADSPSPARVQNCTAGTNGGGISIELGGGIIDNVRVTNCSSSSWGGGIYVVHSGMSVNRCIVEHCVSGEGGGVVFRSETSLRHVRSNFYNSIIYGCEATDPLGGNPAGGLTLAAMGSLNVATCLGDVIAGTVVGAAVRCRRGGPESQAGQPILTCSSFHADAANPIASSDVVAGARCDTAFNGGINNQDGLDPMYCSNLANYQLQEGSPLIDSNCDPGGKRDRGAQPDGGYCSGNTTALSQATWGQIKAAYR